MTVKVDNNRAIRGGRNSPFKRKFGESLNKAFYRNQPLSSLSAGVLGRAVKKLCISTKKGLIMYYRELYSGA